MLKYFTRKATILLDPNEISFDISKLGNDEVQQNEKYKLFDIASYQIQFPNSRFACLILRFKSGSKKEFSFRRQILSDEQSDTDVIIETIHETLDRHQIEFAPSFYASQKGLYTIILLLFLLCIASGIALYLNKNLPLTIFGGVLITSHIISRRISDLNFYKKWKKV